MTSRTSPHRFSAGRALVLGFGGVLLLVVGLVGWSVLASISGAVVAGGRVEVENHNQVVEHIEGGTVSEILVRNGDRVTEGDVLLCFSDGRLRSEEAILEAQLAELMARRNRLEAEFQGAAAIVWDDELAAMAAAPRVEGILDGQERLFLARAAARAGEVAQLRERIGQTREEIAGLEAQAASLQEQVGLVDRELKAQRTLFDKQLTRLDRLLAVERAAEDLKGRMGSVTASIARARGRIAEYEIQILQIDTGHIEQTEALARDVQAQENEVAERLSSVRASLDRMEVRAPVSGEVFGLTVFAPQEVVRPGEPILQIMPEDAGMVVMAQLNPIDVDQVYPGQEAKLRFSAFPARVTPEFDGHVVRVSPDAVRDTQSGASWYEVELALDGPLASGGESGADETGNSAGAIQVAGDLALTPGMPVEAHIRTSERSVMSYLVKPVTDFFYRSLRED
ncbi:MAG: HlyD family type I secretion periplasmic adaptor subunit [Rhodospirillaceae bacterium]|nr:HlyD family type I secretion periplasmic adaptor subunit [Rhodospirillaceae bacterium]